MKAYKFSNPKLERSISISKDSQSDEVWISISDYITGRTIASFVFEFKSEETEFSEILQKLALPKKQ